MASVTVSGPSTPNATRSITSEWYPGAWNKIVVVAREDDDERSSTAR
jgi:hypothetical protein